MTVQEMHVDFRIKMDKLATESNVSFNTAQIDWLLSEAQLILVKNTVRTRFDSTQANIDKISTLIVHNESVTPTQSTEDASIYEVSLDDLNKPYMHFIRGKATIKDGDCTKTLPLKFVQHDDLNDTISDPFNGTGVDHIIFNFATSSGSQVMLVYTNPELSQEITNVSITYVKRPSNIRTGGYEYLDGTTTQYNESELPSHVHPEIVDLAVVRAAANVEDPQLIQLKLMQSTNNK